MSSSNCSAPNRSAIETARHSFIAAPVEPDPGSWKPLCGGHRASEIPLIHAEKGNYDVTFMCRRIAAALNRRGIACSVGLVTDLVREPGLGAVQPRAYSAPRC